MSALSSGSPTNRGGRRAAARRRTAALALFLGACETPPAGTASEDDRAQEHVAAPPSAPAAADCRSWADLDLDRLSPLPASPYVPTFESVWRTVLLRHPDPTLACLDWPGLRLEYGERVAAAPSVADAYGHVNAMLRLLGQSHLRALPPGTAEVDVAVGPAVVPVTVRILEGRAVITQAALDGHESGLPPGAELLAVEGAAVDEIVARELRREGRDAERRLAAARAVTTRLRCPAGGRRELRYRPVGGPVSDASVECVMPAATQSLGNLVDLPVRVETRMIDDAVGYLAFNVWMVPLMASRIEPGLAQLRAQGMRALLIDLRQNPGGVGAMTIPMARQLVESEVHLGRLRMRELVQDYRVEGRPDAFSGPVVLLVDEGTASTSEIFAVGLRGVGRARIVGASTSAGMALPSQIEQLPDGGQLQYVVGEYDGPGGETAEGRGVTPDRLVKETAADYAAGRDPVLAAGVELAREQMQGAK